MIEYDEKLISCYKIVSDFSVIVDERKGRLVNSCDVSEPDVSSKLQYHMNRWGDFYEERHLEEWIAREPSSIFGCQKIMILVSQAYAHLQEKIDLLFVDLNFRFHIVELKIEPIGHLGIKPQQVYSNQMRRYTEYLRTSKVKYLNTYYHRFTRKFYGSERDLLEQLNNFLDRHIDSEDRVNFEINAIYVGESFDEHAINYLFQKGKEDNTNVRLIYYKFYPHKECIQFWELSRKKN